MKKILVIDDDRDMCLLLNKFLSGKGYQVAECYSGKKALEHLETNTPDLVLSDFRLDDMEGNVLLKRIKELHNNLPVIIITGYSDIKIAVEVMKSGARDYIAKPLIPDEILSVIERNLGDTPQNDAELVISRKNKAAANQENSEYIFGETASFTKLLHQVNLVAPTDYSVIIYGESGSGKEVIAHEIHRRSKRAAMPFVAIDCGALSKELAGSELFGHEKGSFTGAVMQKTGSFEIAAGGTIFLDEIANLGYEIQVSLLRVIQERKMRRIGGIKDIELDVRIIIASNESLWNKTRTGKFREDLYHRFNEFAINVPPLRERREDILTFAHHFLKQTNKQLGKRVKGFSPETEDIFLRYVWYGNLRELKNVIKRATLLCEGDWLEARYLPFEISNFAKLQFEPEAAMAEPVSQPVQQRHVETPHRPSTVMAENSLKAASIDVEYEVIVDALKKCGFNKSKAARMLNIDRKTLYNKMNQYQQLNNS